MPPSTRVPLRRVDGRFLLPDWPASARVLGRVPGWSEALEAGHLPPSSGGAEDLVVAPGASAAAAASGRPASLLLAGRPARGGWRRGYHLQRWLALPDTLDPRAWVPRGHRRATSYVLSAWLPGRSRVARLRHRLAAGLARVGLLPPVLPEVCLATARRSPPAILTAAAAAGALPSLRGAEWFLGAESGADSRRLGLFVLPAGKRRPTHLLKLDRRPGCHDSAQREAAGLELVRRAGGAVAARAPRLLGRFDFHGHDVLVQSVCPGTTLSRTLLGPRKDQEKVAVLGRVVTWLREVARETAQPVNGGVPRVFGHGDLAPGNVLVDTAGTFAVVDWEHADPSSYPLWDLLYFSLHALPLLDGQGEEPDEAYLARLFGGTAPSSARLFDWVRTLSADLGLTDDEIGGLAAACWEHYAALVHDLRAALVRSGAQAFPAFPVERLARLWQLHPGLGRDWRARSGPGAD